ncbi:DUF721 domain-containing protein [Leucobacter triazinivorans]|uniref:DUF721 domain-containing protein n=1 Tax=Leucobacter triazinivorans TaxID=1784719 RepID=A0A4P6KFZ9_9MICO|nr:DciA family protein [Leucobacter triazinivorans]QBE48941.1 DUF721 domain-containing protein [Leucobacter triazinivorans]
MRSIGDAGFATETYLRAKAVWRGTTYRKQKRAELAAPGARPFGGGRDPRALGDVILAIAEDLGWSVELEQARVIAEWAEFAGEATAEHTSVVGISNGVLQVQCDSTTWATELRRLRAEMLTRLLRDYPDAEIRDLRFLAPGAPSWRHGPRTVRGRGPRDTYG